MGWEGGLVLGHLGARRGVQGSGRGVQGQGIQGQCGGPWAGWGVQG